MFAGLVLLTPKPKQSKDEELHRALVNLLLESRQSISNISVERTPRSPRPTTRHDATQTHDDAIGGLVPSADDDYQCERRHTRISKENITHIALDAVKDVFNGDPSAMTLSEAMLQNTVNKGDRHRRRAALHKLLGLIKGAI